MSSGTVDQASHHAEPADDHGDHAGHPSEAQYVKIALILAAITGLEVGLYYTSFSQTATNLTLIALAAMKFVIVAAYFMHLKFDNRILRRLFITGFVLATFCYIAYLLTLGVFR
ncbi:MAG TPA: cytochrome C oxidase subunit IV family protein [Acidimicrobiales bacterium]|nr:cytochrome C oxidase subunit IV family protein [Acidimicrobiales bacterium]